MIKSILTATFLSALAGSVTWIAVTALQAGQVIDIDVGDEHGHGPDRGPEWDRAASRKIARRSAFAGLAVWPLLFALFVRARAKPRKPGKAGEAVARREVGG